MSVSFVYPLESGMLVLRRVAAGERVLFTGTAQERMRAVRSFIAGSLPGGRILYCYPADRGAVPEPEHAVVWKLCTSESELKGIAQRLEDFAAESERTSVVLDFGGHLMEGVTVFLKDIFERLPDVTFMTCLDVRDVNAQLFEELVRVHTLLIISTDAERTFVTPLPLPEADTGDVDVLSARVVDGLIKKFLDLVVLSVLQEGPMHGYSIIKTIFQRSGVLVSQGMLYPLLKQLESEGLVARECDRKGRGKVYTLTPGGQEKVRRGRRELQSALAYLLGFMGGGSSISP
ncbi:PadR family transcriptional regulator [Candidatus Pyrohabitans sp.]